MIRFEFWHDGEQLFYWNYENGSFFQRLIIALYVLKSGVVSIKTVNNGDLHGTRRVNGVEYKI